MGINQDDVTTPGNGNGEQGPQSSLTHWPSASRLVEGEKVYNEIEALALLCSIRLTQSRKSIPYKWVIKDHQACKEKG